MPSPNVFRIRRIACWSPGGSHHYHHADIIAPSWQQAIKAAGEGRVRNWRWIDTFDSSPKAYAGFEFLYKVEAAEARNPKRPLSKSAHAALLAAQRAFAKADAAKDRRARARCRVRIAAILTRARQ